MVLITLTCGHRVKARNRPMNPGTLYPCPMNVGCGYRLEWVSFLDEESGKMNPNPRHEAGVKEGDEGVR